MAACNYCGKVIPKKSNKMFCNKKHNSLWHKKNRGNTFTAFAGAAADIVENRKALMLEYAARHPLACAGDKEARSWMRSVLRLRAIWDNVNKKEVRL